MAILSSSVAEFDLPEYDAPTWLALMQSAWRQGEHVVFIGPTGSGKTRTARDLLDCREYVAVFAFKRYDDTLNAYKRVGYKILSAWPPPYAVKRFVLWLKPKSLDDLHSQSVRAFTAMNAILRVGGWTAFFDDTGYATGMLGLAKHLAVFLSQGRSSFISTVAALTQPTSIAQRIPSEVLRQVRHYVIFRFDNEDDLKATARITGLRLSDLRMLMKRLTIYPDGSTDFLVFSRNSPTPLTLVRNTRR